MGLFYPFSDDQDVRLIGALKRQGEGLKPGNMQRRCPEDKPGVLHGNRTYLLQDEDGQRLKMLILFLPA